MTADIEVSKVTGVLLVGGWIKVPDGSFKIHDSVVRFRVGNKETGMLGSSGASIQAATWSMDGNEMAACPLSSVLAVTYR